jgi:hypothetical protein
MKNERDHHPTSRGGQRRGPAGDVTDAINLPSREEMMRLHEQVHPHNHEHEHEHKAHEPGPTKKRSPRRSWDLGWA